MISLFCRRKLDFIELVYGPAYLKLPFSLPTGTTGVLLPSLQGRGWG